MDIRTAVAYRILELCEQNHLAITRLARISAVPPSTLKNVVNGGSKNPGIVTIKKICDGLEISINDFFDSPLFEGLEQEIK
ncbi:helix-turn-helix domain-containing protein [Anaerotruncus rubiinfantis]|uniref:helix-turn-helix domain-containing protein n=1 Tax=Anaerotruncus rubiinfantis TaxID=1720200 RepID=UPI0034A3F5A2